MLLRAAIILAGTLIASDSVQAADKAKRSKERSSSSSSSASSSNGSIRTQQETGDALVQKLHGDAATSRPARSADDVQTALADLDEQIRAENDRHDSAVAALKKSSKGSSAKKALAQEQAAHDKRVASLNEQREALLAKSDGKSDAGTTSTRSTPESESSPPPPSKKSSKASGNTRSR
jgi:hypothetical protein